MRQRRLRVLGQREDHAVALQPGAVVADDPQHVFRDVLHPREALDLGHADLRAAQHRRADQLVRIADQDRALLARAFHRGLQALRKVHRRELLRARQADPSSVVSSVGGVDQRIVEVDLDRRDLGRKDAAVAEELAQVDRHVRAREELLERLDRNLVEGLVGGLADLAIRILEQQHENRELLVRARRQRALRRLQAHVALDLAALEEIQQRRRDHHRTCR